MLFFQRSYFYCVIFSCLLFVINDSCHSSKGSPINTSENNSALGKQLASRYCQSCHELPDPSLLDKKTWTDHVLPVMGPYLGIFYYLDKKYPSYKRDTNLSPGFYPGEPILNPAQWQAIMDYYGQEAPDSLSRPQRNESIKESLPFFTAMIPKMHYDHPASCYASVDTLGKEHNLLFCDVFKKKLYRFNNQLQLTDSMPTQSPVVDIDFQNNQMTLCNIGIMTPNNGKSGSLERVAWKKGKKVTDSSIIFDKLARPVQLTQVDLNRDGRMDYVVCEFGHLTGALSWLEQQPNKKYVRHLLRAVPGAIRACINDYNHDGLPDIWVLFAQGDESIYLFTNKGNGVFDQQRILRFPPMYGSSSFELDDFNHDGFPDVLYTCGDNADFSMILKPYHGLYIYLNDGNNHFNQKYFFPMDGCYRAIAKDFDGDGDLDIAAISFFADYKNQPQEGFVYLLNSGDFRFTPYTSPEARMGRWLTMNVADLDGDGKQDIVLGNFSVVPATVPSQTDWKKGPPFLVLRNISK